MYSDIFCNSHLTSLILNMHVYPGEMIEFYCSWDITSICLFVLFIRVMSVWFLLYCYLLCCLQSWIGVYRTFLVAYPYPLLLSHQRIIRWSFLYVLTKKYIFLHSFHTWLLATPIILVIFAPILSLLSPSIQEDLLI